MLKVMWAPMGKLVPQLPDVVTFAYDLCFRCVIAHWKGIFENYTLCCQILTLTIVWLWKYKKTMFRAPKWRWKYIKMYWHENFQNNPFGLGGCPPISTWQLCRDSNNLKSVEPTITKNYIRTCWTKTVKRNQLE